jgi:hypothetical protein
MKKSILDTAGIVLIDTVIIYSINYNVIQTIMKTRKFIIIFEV